MKNVFANLADLFVPASWSDYRKDKKVEEAQAEYERRVTGYTAKNFVADFYTRRANGERLFPQVLATYPTYQPLSFVDLPPRIPRIIANSRTQWVVQQLEAGRVLEVKDIKVENPRWNCPYTPLKAARRYLRAKGTPVKTLRVGQHGEKRYYLEK